MRLRWRQRHKSVRHLLTLFTLAAITGTLTHLAVVFRTYSAVTFYLTESGLVRDPARMPKIISHITDTDMDVAKDELSATVKILCIISTTKDHLQTNMIAVNNTWAKRCNKHIYVCKNESTNPVVISLDILTNGTPLVQDMWEAFKMVYEHYLDEVDWILKVDDTSFIIVENLRYLLSNYDPYILSYLDLHSGKYRTDYSSNRAMFVLSKLGFIKFVEYALDSRKCNFEQEGSSTEEENPDVPKDGLIVKCLEKLNTTIIKSADELGRKMIYPLRYVKKMLTTSTTAERYLDSKVFSRKIRDFSEYSIGFLDLNPEDVYLVDHFLYHTVLHGRSIQKEKLLRNGTDDILPPNRAQHNVRILCLILTTENNLKTRTMAVNSTWARRCTRHLYILKTDLQHPDFVIYNGTESRRYFTHKVKTGFEAAYDYYLDEFDWVVKADDDAYFIVENLKHLLKYYNPNDKIVLGTQLGYYKNVLYWQLYDQGGTGYVLSKASVVQFVEKGLKSRYCQFVACDTCSPSEDLAMGTCLDTLRVKFVNTLDNRRRGRFHIYTLKHHLFGTIPEYIWSHAEHPLHTGRQCCSEESVSFHYMTPDDIYLYDFLLYNITINGRHVPIS